MSNLRTSKGVAWAAFAIVVAAVVCAVCMPGFKHFWWQTFDIFFAFMMVFCHLAALYLYKMSLDASKKLDFLALIFGILAVIAFIVIFFVSQNL